MAIDINFVKTSVELISNKVQSTGAFTVNDFNNACEIAQLDEIKVQRKIFESGLISSDNLSSLKKVVSLQVSSSGVVVQPSDYLYYSTARVKYFVDNESKEKDIDVVKENEVGFRLNNQINPVSKRFPIMAMRNGTFQVFPSDVNYLVLTYIKVPTTPVWGYDLVNGRPDYNASKSTDFELPKELTTDIIYRICQILGIRVKRQDLVQYGIAKEQEIS
tara:strand:+ start:2154 stop:2807 length:654 start_codon:yes stop_codon:yes gene_type:complete